MFGNKKKKYLEELRDVLIELGNTSEEEVDAFISNHHSWVLSETYKRNLPPLAGAWNLGEKSMERIALAHHLKQYDGADDVPRFMFLVSLKINSIMKNAGNSSHSTYLSTILDLPVDIENPDFTYTDLIEELKVDDPSFTK